MNQNLRTAIALCSFAESGDFEELNRLATHENYGQARADGLTPLMCAARAGGKPRESHVTCAALLLTLAGGREDRERMANAADPDGSSCLHHAAAVDNDGVAKKLLVAGARVNQTDRLGRPPLAVAVQHVSARTTDLLMRAGADPQLADVHGLSPLKIAREAKENGFEMAKRIERWQPLKKIPVDFKEDKSKRKMVASTTRGAYADVFDIQTEPPNLDVVVRVLTRLDKDTYKAELRGLEALKKVKHVNIVQLIRFTDSTTCFELFLEKIEGKTISEVLASDGPFIEVQIQKYFRQLASALCYLHSHPYGPVIHRDINCRNIMIARDGVVKLIDFGFALPSGSVCSSTIAGTLNFMAPEIIAQDVARYSSHSDMWAAGCVLFAMAMGEEPYKGSNPVAIGMKIMGPVPDIGPPNKISSGLRDLFSSCMEKDPSMRISATCMLLHEFLDWRPDQSIDPHLIDDIQEWAMKGCDVIEVLKKIIQNINDSNKAALAAKLGTTSAAVAGGIMATVGFALLIPSFGAALPLAIAGTSLAVAGGVGSATADISGTIVQGKEFKNSQEKICDFKLSTQALVVKCVQSICDSVTTQMIEKRSAIDLADSKVLIVVLKKEISNIKAVLEESEVKKQLTAEQRKEVTQMFETWTIPADNLLEHLSDVENLISERSIDRDASNKFNRALQKAVDFVVRILRILMFGSVEDPSQFYLDHMRGGLRSAVGGAQLGAEIGSAAGRSVLGRIFGIAGSAVFTAVDIGFLAYYSVELHRAKDGANAEKADPIACQIDIFKMLVCEANDLDLGRMIQ